MKQAKEIALSLPFSFDSFKKSTTTTDQPKIWADRVRIVLGTTVRERLMHPNFGTLIATPFMDTQEQSSSIIQGEVEQAFATQLAQLKLTSIVTSFDEYTNVITIEIAYALPNLTEVSTAIGFIALNSNQPAYEETP